MDWLRRLAPASSNRLIAKTLIKALGMQKAYDARVRAYLERRG